MASAFWSGTPLRTVLTGVTDVQTIIDELVSQITAQLPVTERWTSLGSGIYKSVPDSAGAFMTVELIRDTATRLSLKVVDHLARTVFDGSHVIVASDTVYCYSGPNHLALQNTPGSSGNVFWAAMRDLAPEPADTHSFRISVHGEFNSGGGVLGTTGVQDGWTVKPFDQVAVPNPYTVDTFSDTFEGTVYRMLSVDGAEVRSYVPNRDTTESVSAYNRCGGIHHQLAFVDKGNPYRSIVSVGIDAGVSGRFEVLAQLEQSGSRLAIRIPDA